MRRVKATGPGPKDISTSSPRGLANSIRPTVSTISREEAASSDTTMVDGPTGEPNAGWRPSPGEPSGAIRAEPPPGWGACATTGAGNENRTRRSGPEHERRMLAEPAGAPVEADARRIATSEPNSSNPHPPPPTCMRLLCCPGRYRAEHHDRSRAPGSDANRRATPWRPARGNSGC